MENETPMIQFPALVIDGEDYAIISKKDWIVEELENAWFVRSKPHPLGPGLMQAPIKE